MKRSIKSFTGYSTGSIDSEIGKVKEFYFDDHCWIIGYYVEPGDLNEVCFCKNNKVLKAGKVIIR